MSYLVIAQHEATQLIAVSNFCKSYTDAVAVQSLTFSVQPGQILGLIGRNGAGKTTTLRALTGIIPFGIGTIHVGGFEISEHPIEVKKQTAYVPDDPQLFEDLSVEQHLKFQASVYGVAAPGRDIARLLQMFELESKRNTPAKSLSRGMRQKLAICCAYLQQPQALLLDEPMTGLDPQAIRVLKTSIMDQAASGVAVIISSHLLAMVEVICTHVLVLDEGKSRFLGTLSELQQKYIVDIAGTEDLASLESAFFNALSEIENVMSPTDSGPNLVANPPVETSSDSRPKSVSP